MKGEEGQRGEGERGGGYLPRVNFEDSLRLVRHQKTTEDHGLKGASVTKRG